MLSFTAINDKSHAGFQMTFANGCKISVQFGQGSYSDKGINTAEVAAWNPEGSWMIWEENKWIVMPEGETEVMPRCTPEEVAQHALSLSLYI